MYRRWVGVVERMFVLLYERHFGWQRTLRNRIIPPEYQQLYSALDSEEARSMATLMPLSGQLSIPASFRTALHCFLELAEEKAGALEAGLDRGFIAHVCGFADAEIDRFSGDGARPAAPDPRQVVLTYFRRLLNDHDLSVCGELLADDYVDHDAPDTSPPGPEPTREFVSAFLHDYPDMSVDIADCLAEGNRVSVRLVWKGTHRTTGEPYTRDGVVILRLNEAGKIAERWSGYS